MRARSRKLAHPCIGASLLAAAISAVVVEARAQSGPVYGGGGAGPTTIQRWGGGEDPYVARGGTAPPVLPPAAPRPIGQFLEPAPLDAPLGEQPIVPRERLAGAAFQTAAPAATEPPRMPEPDRRPERPLVPPLPETGWSLESEDGVRLHVGGQLNVAGAFVHSGPDQEFKVLDNSHAPSGVNAELLFPFRGHGFLVGVAADIAFQVNASDRLQIDDDLGLSEEIRTAELFIETPRLGRLSVGQGETASDGMMEVDLSGTDVVTGSDLHEIGGGIRFDESYSGGLEPSLGTNSVFNNLDFNPGQLETYEIRPVLLREAYNNFDGLGRRNRLRYDSPEYQGFVGSISATDQGQADLALRWTGSYHDYQIATALAYAYKLDTPRRDEHSHEQTLVGGSFSVLAPFGSNLSFAVGAPEPFSAIDDDEALAQLFYYAKIGQQFQWLPWGITAISADYGFSQSWRVGGEDVEKYGVAVVQKVDSANMDLYLAVHTTDLDEAGFPSNFQLVDEVQTYVTGIRVIF